MSTCIQLTQLDCGIVGSGRWCSDPEEDFKCCGDGNLPVLVDQPCGNEVTTHGI